MPDRHDPFDALRRPIVPLAPRPAFAAALRRRLQEELGMTTTDDASPDGTRSADTGNLVMVHLRVGDADRAMAFFGSLLGWEGERVDFDNHVSHYTINTATTVRLLDDPAAPAVVPNYGVADVAGTIEAIGAAGGVVTEAAPDPDGGGWARGTDDQGMPLLVFRPGRSRASVSPTRVPTGEVGLVFLRADAARAERFYGTVLGWHLTRDDPASQYFDAVPKVGIFDEAAASGTRSSRTPRSTCRWTPWPPPSPGWRSWAATPAPAPRTWAPTSAHAAPTTRAPSSASSPRPSKDLRRRADRHGGGMLLPDAGTDPRATAG